MNFVRAYLRASTTEQDALRAKADSQILGLFAGAGSFARISMQRGSELVSVSLQSFKRYASEGPKAHCISFAAWHLLLHRLSIQSLPTQQLSWCG